MSRPMIPAGTLGLVSLKVGCVRSQHTLPKVATIKGCAIRKHVRVLLGLLAMFVPACAQSPDPATDSSQESAVDTTREEAIGTLKDADQAWAHTTDAEAFLSFFTEDALWLYCNRPKMDGKEEIGAYVSNVFAMPEFTLDWQPARIEVGASGDMGYTAGNWRSSYENSDGQLAENIGSYLAIWKKQEDGKWKVAVEIDFPSQELFHIAEPRLD